MNVNLPNDVNLANPPIQISFPMPNSPSTHIYIHLTVRAASILLFLSSASADSGSSSVPMGSFVYAMPNMRNPTNPPMLTALYPLPGTLDLANRVARVLAKRTKKPVYVGNSVSFGSTALGGTVEEEIETIRKVVEVASKALDLNI